jgi:hypothetical protein
VPVTFRGHAANLMRQIVRVKAMGVDGGVIVGEPEASDARRIALQVMPPHTGC